MHRRIAVLICSVGLAACAGPGFEGPIAISDADMARLTAPRFVDENQIAVGRELRALDDRVDDARDSGSLTRQERRRLRRSARGIEALADRYASDWLTDQEAKEIEFRARALSSQIGPFAQQQPE